MGTFSRLLIAIFTMTPCACYGQFATQNMELLAHVPNVTGATTFDLWGWTDSQTGTEYALVGHNSGVDIYDLSNPSSPDYRGRWTAPSGFDVKVYGDYAYAVNGGSFGNTHVLDLSKVRNAATPQDFSSDNSFSPSFHNVFVNEETGYLYGVSPTISIYDLNSDPLNPTFISDTGGGGHDAMSTIYQGPDSRYQGKEILFGSQESSFRIYDVADKSNVTRLATSTFPQQSYIHQGWLSQDHEHFFIADEGDSDFPGSRTHVYDVSNLESPQYKGFYAGPTNAIDHNLYVKGELLYLANYGAGTRVIRLDDPDNLDMTEIAHIDTYPEGNPGSFVGAFTAYPYFESGTIITSDLGRGLFVTRLDLGNDPDFDDDGAFDCNDIDALVAEVVGGVHSIEFDITDDGLVTFADVQQWLNEVSVTLGVLLLPGDANLDGSVDVSDFNIWNQNKFTSGGGWCAGDFNADGNVDVADFNAWNAHKFNNPFVTVPEPDCSLAFLTACGLLCLKFRRTSSWQ